SRCHSSKLPLRNVLDRIVIERTLCQKLKLHKVFRLIPRNHRDLMLLIQRAYPSHWTLYLNQITNIECTERRVAVVWIDDDRLKVAWKLSASKSTLGPCCTTFLRIDVQVKLIHHSTQAVGIGVGKLHAVLLTRKVTL